VTVEIPESMRDSIQCRVAEGGYTSIGEYVSDLIRADLEQKSDEGEPIVVDEEYWKRKRERLMARHGKAAEAQ
jgi:Arc/MetJ-type ribon-helix-helix transcriptional regulator